MNEVLAALGIVFGAIATHSGRVLVVERLRKADLILVLSGEREVRLQHAFRLFRQGWADRVVIVALSGVTPWPLKASPKRELVKLSTTALTGGSAPTPSLASQEPLSTGNQPVIDIVRVTVDPMLDAFSQALSAATPPLWPDSYQQVNMAIAAGDSPVHLEMEA